MNDHSPTLRTSTPTEREAASVSCVSCPKVGYSNAIPTTPRNIAPENDLFQSGFDASWELDLFGRVRRTVEAASADLAATEDSRRDVLVTLLAEVARNYVEVRGVQQRLDITRDNIRTQQQTVELTTARFAAGLSSELDVTQALNRR